MPLYEFRCASGDVFEAMFAMAEVPDAVPCPGCGEDARRRVSPPRLSRTGTAAFRAVDSAARSASEPAVVTGTPPGRRKPRGAAVTRNPLHAKLPRP